MLHAQNINQADVASSHRSPTVLHGSLSFQLTPQRRLSTFICRRTAAAASESLLTVSLPPTESVWWRRGTLLRDRSWRSCAVPAAPRSSGVDPKRRS